MLVRRLVTNLKTQNWSAIAIELLIVVLGVFIGIQVSNWNSERLEQRVAGTYIKRIRADLEANRKDLDARAAYYGKVRQHAQAAIAGFDRAPESLGGQFLIDAYQASQITPRTLGRNTYDEVLSVGAINSITDLEVRQRLANYYLSAQTQEVIMRYIPPYRETLRRHMPFEMQREILANCDEAMSIDANGLPMLQLPDNCTIAPPASAIAAAVDAILIPEVRLDLNRALVDLDSKLRAYRIVNVRAQALSNFLAGIDQ